MFIMDLVISIYIAKQTSGPNVNKMKILKGLRTLITLILAPYFKNNSQISIK